MRPFAEYCHAMVAVFHGCGAKSKPFGIAGTGLVLRQRGGLNPFSMSDASD